MEKTTVILADPDEKYLAPLEVKFLEELDAQIELEVITQKAYFERCFSAPKSADVLVVSESFYSRELQKHNIESIFVLAEQPDEGGTEDLGITKIFKYTSIKEIFNQIMALSSIRARAQKKAEAVVALFYSASGGVGKTTLALGVSAFLAKSYKKVLYINAQRLHSFQYYFKNTAAIPNRAYCELVNGGANLFNRIQYTVRNELFDYLPPFGAALSSLNIDFSVYGEIIQSAKNAGKYDVIVVDTDTVFDEDKAELITLADKVILVVSQTESAAFAARTLLQNMSCRDDEKYCFVCNNFDAEKPNALISADQKPGFIINEYVGHISDADSVSALARQADIQKISYLII